MRLIIAGKDLGEFDSLNLSTGPLDATASAGVLSLVPRSIGVFAANPASPGASYVQAEVVALRTAIVAINAILVANKLMAAS